MSDNQSDGTQQFQQFTPEELRVMLPLSDGLEATEISADEVLIAGEVYAGIAALQSLAKAGYVERDNNGCWRTTVEGMLLYDEVVRQSKGEEPGQRGALEVATVRLSDEEIAAQLQLDERFRVLMHCQVRFYVDNGWISFDLGESDESSGSTSVAVELAKAWLAAAESTPLCTSVTRSIAAHAFADLDERSRWEIVDRVFDAAWQALTFDEQVTVIRSAFEQRGTLALRGVRHPGPADSPGDGNEPFVYVCGSCGHRQRLWLSHGLEDNDAMGLVVACSSCNHAAVLKSDHEAADVVEAERDANKVIDRVKNRTKRN
jgi:DNA-directed RNA polymerase subunit RPC12/RpoP